MSFQFTICKQMAFLGQLDLEGDTIKARLLMTNSTVTVAAQIDIATISALTTQDKHNGAGYVDKTLAGCDVSAIDTVNHRISFTFTAETWAALGAGTRDIKGILIYFDTTGTNADATNIPLFWIDDGFPTPATGSDFVYTPNAAGIWYW